MTLSRIWEGQLLDPGELAGSSRQLKVFFRASFYSKTSFQEGGRTPEGLEGREAGGLEQTKQEIFYYLALNLGEEVDELLGDVLPF